MNERPTPPSSANSAPPRFNLSSAIFKTRRRGERGEKKEDRLHCNSSHRPKRRRFKNDTERLEKLFEMYTEMTSKDSE